MLRRDLHTTGWQMLVWGFFISTVLVYHGTYTINSLSHVFGRQRYKTGDASRNNPWLAIITLGEGWHNNHHHYPASVRQGFYWWEFDITFYLLKLMSFFGVIWDLKPVPAAVRDGGGKRLLNSAPCRARPSSATLAELKEAVGPGNFLDSHDDLAPYLTDFRRLYQGATPLVLRPRSVDEVAQDLKDLQSRRSRGGAARRQHQLLRRRHSG